MGTLQIPVEHCDGFRPGAVCPTCAKSNKIAAFTVRDGVVDFCLDSFHSSNRRNAEVVEIHRA